MDRSGIEPEVPNYLVLEDGNDLSTAEIEVRLAIADYVIRRAAATPGGRKIFEALIPRFEDKYPHHKLLSLYLTSPGHIDPESVD